jgi:two-component system cell cycle response regulator DivK
MSSTTNTNEVGSARARPLGLCPPAWGPKVLIAEDHEDTREMLRIILEQKGWRVIEASNGLQAVELAASEQPDLILMDGSLPLFDGIEATRRIREQALLHQVFIIALNGWGTPSFHAAALAAGCNDCLVKPIDFERLECHLAPFFERSAVAV